MKHHLLSFAGAVFLLSGAQSFQASAADHNAAPTEPQAQVQAQAPIAPQSVCGKRARFVSQLNKRFKEKPVSIGLAADGSMIEVFAAASGSFSILLTRPEGISCLVSSGENWQVLPTRKADLKI